MRRAVLIACASFVFAAPSGASVVFYTTVDEAGTLHVARKPLSADYVPLVLGNEVKITASMSTRTAWRTRLREVIQKITHEHGVAYELVDALILAESGYDPNAISNKGAVGLMQLMPATATRFGVRDRTDPEDNIRGGVKYLRWLLDRYEKVDLALAAYNAGEGAVDKAGGVPNYRETKGYVDRVLSIIGKGIK